jgi:hypothetical protein
LFDYLIFSGCVCLCLVLCSRHALPRRLGIEEFQTGGYNLGQSKRVAFPGAVWVQSEWKLRMVYLEKTARNALGRYLAAREDGEEPSAGTEESGPIHSGSILFIAL